MNKIYFLRVMRLFVLFSIVGFMHVSAASFSQTVTLKGTHLAFEEVIRAIRQQTGYEVYMDMDRLKETNPVSVAVSDMPLEDFIQLILKNQPLESKIEGKTISLVRKQTLSSSPNRYAESNGSQQPSRVSFRVLDPDGKPLSGASFFSSSSKNHVSLGLTDGEGRLSLNVSLGDRLEVSYVGFEPISVVVSNEMLKNGTFSISLKISINNLDEAVITKGYYSTTKLLNTGSISTVKSDVISRQPISDPMAALEGNVPGLSIQQSSGGPGRAYKIQLRGRNSIANGNNPLIIVDGVPFSNTTLSSTFNTAGNGQSSQFNYINPSDIYSIDILKDADATAIYGSRGANGVILITTKKGKTGKTAIDVNAYSGVGKITRTLDLMNTQEYLAMRKQAFANDSATPTASDYDLNGTYDQNKYTDWQKKLIGGTANISDAQLAASGGNDQTTFRLGGGYHYETTVYPGDFNTKRVNAIMSIQHISDNKKLRINFTTSYVEGMNNIPSMDLTQFIMLAPNAPDTYTADGKLNWANSTFSNPLQTLFQSYKEDTRNLIGNVVVSYRLFDGLQLKASFGYNRDELDQDRLRPFSSQNPAFASNANALRQHFMANNAIATWIVEPQISYSKKLSIGNFDALIGTTAQGIDQKTLALTATGFTSDGQLNNMQAGSSLSVLTNAISQYRYDAIYGRLGYNIADKYIVNFTGRRDGSSRFGPGKQFGNFWSAGASWVFSNEKFINENLKFLSLGKLRGSLGTTGNDNLTNYKYLSSYSSYTYSYQGVSSIVPTQLANPFYGWEKVSKIDLALELGFLDNRIMLNAGAFRCRTGNQLVGYSLPSITGFSSIQANLPAVIENKGLEFDLTSSNIATKNFQWNTTANLTIPRNKLVSYPNIAASSYSTSYAVGQPLLISYRYAYTGIDPATGLYTFKDMDGDKQINSPGDLVPTFVGQKFYGGITNNFKYRDWELAFMFQFTKQTGQNYLYNATPGGYSGGAGNQPRSVINSKTIEPLTQDYNSAVALQGYLFDQSDGRITDASYIRLRNLQLAWNLPEKWRSGSGIKNARIYLQCQNLLTITNYKGLDPEIAGGLLTLPPLRTFVFGAQFSL
ncbi:TonB-linked outer membrane protein, SusC/RagA family [bacterium A37T11]|nr:TonB-linked outer membrane protein, SusC/RagA family [bacterium A37T11]